MRRTWALLPILTLVGTALPGCVAVAIPVLAGSAMAGSQIVGSDGEDSPARSAAAPPAATTVAAAAPAPSRVLANASGSASITRPPAASAAPAPAPAPALSAPPPSEPAPTAETPASRSTGFARLVRYGRGLALARSPETGSLSAILNDPFALDGKRSRCPVGEQHVALIDLDPAGSVLVPPAAPERQQGLALGLAVLREAGVVIAWISDLSINESGALRTALEKSGLDPRGEDIISLRRDGDDRKQERRDNLAKTACIIAIGGDERADFDERFRYLRNPEAGAALEPVIGDGWFLIDPVFPVAGEITK
jgi:hypothetical protein